MTAAAAAYSSIGLPALPRDQFSSILHVNAELNQCIDEMIRRAELCETQLPRELFTKTYFLIYNSTADSPAVTDAEFQSFLHRYLFKSVRRVASLLLPPEVVEDISSLKMATMSAVAPCFEDVCPADPRITLLMCEIARCWQSFIILTRWLARCVKPVTLLSSEVRRTHFELAQWAFVHAVLDPLGALIVTAILAARRLYLLCFNLSIPQFGQIGALISSSPKCSIPPGQPVDAKGFQDLIENPSRPALRSWGPAPPPLVSTSGPLGTGHEVLSHRSSSVADAIARAAAKVGDASRMTKLQYSTELTRALYSDPISASLLLQATQCSARFVSTLVNLLQPHSTAISLGQWYAANTEMDLRNSFEALLTHGSTMSLGMIRRIATIIDTRESTVAMDLSPNVRALNGVFNSVFVGGLVGRVVDDPLGGLKVLLERRLEDKMALSLQGTGRQPPRHFFTIHPDQALDKELFDSVAFVCRSSLGEDRTSDIFRAHAERTLTRVVDLFADVLRSTAYCPLDPSASLNASTLADAADSGGFRVDPGVAVLCTCSLLLAISYLRDLMCIVPESCVNQLVHAFRHGIRSALAKHISGCEFQRVDGSRVVAFTLGEVFGQCTAIIGSGSMPAGPCLYSGLSMAGHHMHDPSSAFAWLLARLQHDGVMPLLATAVLLPTSAPCPAAAAAAPVGPPAEGDLAREYTAQIVRACMPSNDAFADISPFSAATSDIVDMFCARMTICISDLQSETAERMQRTVVTDVATFMLIGTPCGVPVHSYPQCFSSVLVALSALWRAAPLDAQLIPIAAAAECPTPSPLVDAEVSAARIDLPLSCLPDVLASRAAWMMAVPNSIAVWLQSAGTSLASSKAANDVCYAFPPAFARVSLEWAGGSHTVQCSGAAASILYVLASGTGPPAVTPAVVHPSDFATRGGARGASSSGAGMRVDGDDVTSPSAAGASAAAGVESLQTPSQRVGSLAARLRVPVPLLLAFLRPLLAAGVVQLVSTQTPPRVVKRFIPAAVACAAWAAALPLSVASRVSLSPDGGAANAVLGVVSVHPSMLFDTAPLVVRSRTRHPAGWREQIVDAAIMRAIKQQGGMAFGALVDVCEKADSRDEDFIRSRIDALISKQALKRSSQAADTFEWE